MCPSFACLPSDLLTVLPHLHSQATLALCVRDVHTHAMYSRTRVYIRIFVGRRTYVHIYTFSCTRTYLYMYTPYPHWHQL